MYPTSRRKFTSSTSSAMSRRTRRATDTGARSKSAEAAGVGTVAGAHARGILCAGEVIDSGSGFLVLGFWVLVLGCGFAGRLCAGPDNVVRPSQYILSERISQVSQRCEGLWPGEKPVLHAKDEGHVSDQEFRDTFDLLIARSALPSTCRAYSARHCGSSKMRLGRAEGNDESGNLKPAPRTQNQTQNQNPEPEPKTGTQNQNPEPVPRTQHRNPATGEAADRFRQFQP